jgi:hypothetical protein
MSRKYAYPELTERFPAHDVHDLQDLGDMGLTDAGELVIDPHFEGPLMLRLGGDVLELSRMSLPAEDSATGAARNAYQLRNINAAPGAAVLLDDALLKDTELEDTGISEGLTGFRKGASWVVGRETTPALDLSELADAEHIVIRADGYDNELRIYDLDTTFGTQVLVPQADRGLKPIPARGVHIRLVDGKPQGRTKTEELGRWRRD